MFLIINGSLKDVPNFLLCVFLFVYLCSFIIPVFLVIRKHTLQRILFRLCRWYFTVFSVIFIYTGSFIIFFALFLAVNPPYVIVDGIRHGLMAIGQALCAIIAAALTGSLLLWFYFFRFKNMWHRIEGLPDNKE
ncbi:MAG: hypothetical protein V1874_06415 [Spirochaetota bacterium]